MGHDATAGGASKEERQILSRPFTYGDLCRTLRQTLLGRFLTRSQTRLPRPFQDALKFQKGRAGPPFP